jgi:tripartite-type tricarboxylate transporter receptor subunit TctC
VKTLKEFVTLCKKSPGKMNFLNGGDGSISHLVPELLRHKYGVDIGNVPYKGAAPGMPDLLTNRVQLGVIFNSLAEPHLVSGRLVALAIVDETRAASLPQLPTISEAGFPDALVTSRWFLLAPAKTHPAVLASLSEKLQKGLADPATHKKFEGLGMVMIPPGPPVEVDRYIASAVGTWKTFFKDSGLKFN